MMGAAAAGLHESVGSILTPAERLAFEDDMVTARTALGGEAFATACADCRARPLSGSQAELAAHPAAVTRLMAGALRFHGIAVERAMRQPP